ncbi:MAG TPA: hypothetical protein V6C76_12720 [Drouetiella sp.]
MQQWNDSAIDSISFDDLHDHYVRLEQTYGERAAFNTYHALRAVLNSLDLDATAVRAVLKNRHRPTTSNLKRFNHQKKQNLDSQTRQASDYDEWLKVVNSARSVTLRDFLLFVNLSKMPPKAVRLLRWNQVVNARQTNLNLSEEALSILRERNHRLSPDSQDYIFSVNGKPIYVRKSVSIGKFLIPVEYGRTTSAETKQESPKRNNGAKFAMAYYQLCIKLEQDESHEFKPPPPSVFRDTFRSAQSQ